MSDEPDGASPAVTYGCVAIFCAPFAWFGLTTLYSALTTRQPAIDTAIQTMGAAALLVFAAMPLIAVRLALKFEPTRKQLRQIQLATPAKWKPEWTAGRLADQADGNVRPLLITGSILLTVAALLMVVAVPPALRGQYAPLAVFGIVPLLAIGTLIAYFRGLARRRRFGRSELVLAKTPAKTGEVLQAELVIEHFDAEAETFTATLSCIERRTSVERRSGGATRRHTWTAVKWSETHAVPRGAPITFQIPADALPTNDVLTDDVIFWQLEVSASVPGVDYYSRFEVPVYR